MILCRPNDICMLTLCWSYDGLYKFCHLFFGLDLLAAFLDYYHDWQYLLCQTVISPKIFRTDFARQLFEFHFTVVFRDVHHE